MALVDSNKVIHAYLAADVALDALVDGRIYCPRLPENAELPAVGFFCRGGTSTPYIPDLPMPSVQFDCWASSPMVARQVYRALYDALQGVEWQAVTVDSETHYLVAAREEVQGQDLVDTDIPGYFRVLAFFEIMVR